MRPTRVLLVFAAVAALASPALALQQYGSIAGSVVDSDGTALPGVTIMVTGPALQGTRTAISDADGQFRLTPLPPGDGYLVVFGLQGFDRLEHADIPVRIGNTTEIDATMNLVAFGETVEVTADRIVVDTTKSAIDTAVGFELIDSLYNPRNFQGVMDMVPGVQRNANNPRVHGAADADNLYLIDGVDTTDPRVQKWGTQLNFDTVAEVQVQTSGYSAEYGRATGGVVNLVTKSGGNEFHGLARYIVSKASWAADVKEGVTASILGDEQRPSLNIGGRIIRDKLWFFVGYEDRGQDQVFPRYTDETVTELTEDTREYKGHYIQGKVTWQVNQNNTLVGFYNEDPIDITNVWARYYLGPEVDPRTESTQQQGGDNHSLQWTSILSEDAFLEVKYGYYGGFINLTAQGPLGPEPTSLDLDTGWWSGTTLEEYLSDRERSNISAALSYFLDTSTGSHQLKGGIEWLENKNTVTDVYYPSGGLTGPGEFIMTSGGENDTRIRMYDRDGALESTNPYWAVFLQDSWNVGNLTVNAGLRAEKIDLKNHAGQTIVGFDFTDQIAPRLGFAYDLNGDSVHASVGRFYDITTDYLTASMQPSTERQAIDLWGPAYELGEDGWVEVADFPIRSANLVDPGLTPNYTDEVTVGYDKRLSSSMSVGANYIWRQQKDAIEDFDSGTNGDPVADDGSFYWNNVDGTWLEYQAVELVLRKVLDEDGFQFMTSYTYNFQNEGYATRGSGGITNFADQAGDYGDTSVSIENRWGDLDTAHLVKFDGSYTHPFGAFGLVTGVSAFYYSGPVWTSIENVGGLATTGYRFVEPAGSRDVGSQYELNLHLEGLYNFSSSLNAGLYFDVLNLTNEQMAIRVNSNPGSSSYTSPNLWNTQRRYQVGVKIEF